MKTFNFLFAVITVALLIAPCSSRAADITFTSSGTIDDPQVWDQVDVRNDGTVLQILGGTVDWLNAYDASRVEMQGGTVSTINMENASTFRIIGGTTGTGYIILKEGSTAYFEGGIVDSFMLKMYPGSVANVYGGDINCQFSLAGTLNIYGTDFHIETIHQWDGDYYNLTCKLLADGNPFSLNYIRSFQNINLIPEPATLCFLIFGGLFLQRRQSCRK